MKRYLKFQMSWIETTRMRNSHSNYYWKDLKAAKKLMKVGVANKLIWVNNCREIRVEEVK